jgi:hypothetical protein
MIILPSSILAIGLPLLLVLNFLLFDKSGDRRARNVVNRAYPLILLLSLVFYTALIVKFSI